MNNKWYISALVIILAVLGGIASQEQNTIPNQEIVLQFEDVDLTSKQAENTVAIVKQQLQDLGAENIQVFSLENGKLKITYFSDSEVASIKETFSEESNLTLHLTSQIQDENASRFPFEESNISYNLDVYEIQNGFEYGWGGAPFAG